MVFISDPPDVSLMPSTQLTVNITFQATLVCFVFAIPLPKITWIRNADQSIVVEQPGRVSITQEDNIHNRTSTLFFSETLKTDESSYTCVAVNNITNVIDTPENATVDLIVQGKQQKCMYIDNVFNKNVLWLLSLYALLFLKRN